MKKACVLSLILIITFISCDHLISCPYRDSDNNQELLKKILEKTASYCERVKKIALFYVCEEKIQDKKYLYRQKVATTRAPSISGFLWTTKYELRGTKTTNFTYDYQLINKEGRLEEKRVLLEESGKKTHKENAKLSHIKYVSKYLIYGPVGFLSKYWQEFFNYKIIGKDYNYINKEEAIIVSASPKSFMEENYNFGKIWVNDKDFSILRIEWEPQSITDYKESRVKLPAEDLVKTVVWNVEYGVEKNGIRFPSRQFVQEALVSDRTTQKVVLEDIFYFYGDYKFFIVDVEIKY